MTRWAVVASVVIVSGLGLGACSSGTNPLAQMKLAGQNDDMCQSGSSAGNGMSSARASYSECMQERYADQPMGFSNGGRFAPGSSSSSLSQVGQ